MKWILVVAGAIIAIPLLFLYLSYIDETVVKGGKYGFEIGMTKEEAYQRAASIYKGDKIYILYPLNERGWGPHYQVSFKKDEYDFILNRERWAFYFDDGYFNTIELAFTNGRLSEIYRHRKYFELP